LSSTVKYRTFWELDPLPSSGAMWTGAHSDRSIKKSYSQSWDIYVHQHTGIQWLRIALSNEPTRVAIFPPFDLKTGADSTPKMLCSIF